MISTPLVRDVFLIGGGHSHVLLIRRWAMRPLPGVRLTLISSDSQTPYSGMLPGLVAGHYSVEDIHVDLRVLCSWAGVRFVEDTVVGLDLDARQVHMSGRPSMSFDVLSLDTGSTPDLSVDGASEHCTPVKPVYNFSTRWTSIVSRINTTNSDSVTIGVVGSGAGGFELITAMRHALPAGSAKCLWFLRGELPLRGRPPKVGKLALASARKQGIEVVTGFDVVKVGEGELRAADGRQFDVDEILWCTAAIGPGWVKHAGFDLDKRGFVSTNAHLQSVSHPFVFATGDIGTQVETPSAKAGVFAVRQAPVLYENIRRHLLNQSLKTYSPQKDFLSLMATGGKRAIASRGSIVIEADWVWRWKDHIDRTFMRQFVDLPAMKETLPAQLPSALQDKDTVAASDNPMRCRGCGAKVSSRVLDRVLASLNVMASKDVVSGHKQASDTAIVTLPTTTLVQSVDHLNALVDDPYLLGRIAAVHALSDVVTVAATPHSAQVIVSLPEASEEIIERDLQQLMIGLVEALNEEGCVLVGGHTTLGAELSIGVVINATQAEPQPDMSEESENLFTADDVLVITQGLGTGTLFAGLMQQNAQGADIRLAIDAMQMSNQPAAQLLRQHGAYAMTDITGFGLLGHADRMLRGLQSDAGMQITLNDVPLLSGAKSLANQKVRSSLWQSNSRILEQVTVAQDVDLNHLSLLCDPQTSGGLLAIVPAQHQDSIVAELQALGYSDAAVIGSVNASGGYLVI